MKISEHELLRETRGWTDAQRHQFLDELRLKAARVKYPTPASMAAALLPGYRVTPAIEAISEVVREAIHTPDGRFLVTTPPRTGKLMSMDTRIPTPDGWTDHGSIQVGDTVFHPDGTPIKVLAVHAPAMADHRVHFSDGSHVDVHGGHEWTVWDRSRKPAPEKDCLQCGRRFVGWSRSAALYCSRACSTRARWGHTPDYAGRSLPVLGTALQWRTVETRYLASVRLSSGVPGTRGHRYRFQLPFTDALKCEPADLPVDPYTLGVWLGDGTASKAAITHISTDNYDIPYPVSARSVHADTGIVTDHYGGELLARLTELGVRNRKHVPMTYLRASEDQRRELLAGLIDSDGHISPDSSITFSNANRELIDGVYALVRGLGYRASVNVSTEPGALGGLRADGMRITATKTCWNVQFTPHDHHVPARLERKARNHHSAVRRRVSVVRVERIAPVPGRCITVDSEDGLYLVGDTLIPTHNSEVISVVGPAWANVHRPGIEVMLASYSDTLATEHSRKSRRLIVDHGDELGVRLSGDKTAVGHWTTNHGTGRGGLLAGGILSGMTGFGAGLLIVDDVVKNAQEADSETYRRRILSEFRETLMTRLYPGASVIIVMCMTGDTPVLRPDGSETPLRDIRPGDVVATYENGGLSTSVVRNWADQGPDDVICIKMKSGREVRANARHPFLVVEGGREKWVRTGSIRRGQFIRLATGVSGAVSSAPSTWTVTEDEVVSVHAAGREHVYDIQVDRTENFIANGLVSHNTRWHPEDLAGTLLAEGGWTYINIPAQAERGIPDALEREHGVYLESALGFTPKDFADRRKQIGERAWYALYQGAPAPPDGGLFAREWFSAHRLTVQPERSILRLVAVDPAETGDRDEAGVVAAALLPDGTVALTHDRSERMTSDQWAHAAVKLAMETGASEIAVETYTAGTTYVNVVKRAIAAYRQNLRKDYDGNDPETSAAIRRSYELTVFPWRGKGDAVARSASLRQAIEVGTCRVVADELAEMESQAVLWQVGQHQPDRVAASVIAHDRLLALGGRKTTLGSPIKSANRPAGANPGRAAWLGRKLVP